MIKPISIDELCLQIKEFLSDYRKSPVLQNYFLNKIESLFYGNLINNFFINLNHKNIKDYNLPKGQIDKIKRKYKETRKHVKLALGLSLKNKKIDENYYDSFKSKIENDFPEFLKIFSEIEKEIEIDNAKNYLKKKEDEIKNFGISDTNFNSLITTCVLEAYVKSKKSLPIGKKSDKLLKVTAKKIIPIMSREYFKDLKNDSKKMLITQRKQQKGFKKRLYERWKKPLDLLEVLIRISLESGEEKKNKLSSTTDSTNRFRRKALIEIHARALQVSNEILVLLKSGYSDGANARSRSLIELAIISLFLLDSNNDISERYLDYEILRKFKEAKEYRKYYKKLGYPPLLRKEFNKIKREKDKLCAKYNLDDNDIMNDWAWIPKSILKHMKGKDKGKDKRRNFKNLEEHVTLGKFSPYYSFSSDSIHGGAKGFYRLGLIDNYQGKVLLTGPSNYGLADPIRITAVSLLYVSICLLNLEPDFDSLIHMQTMKYHVNEINITAFIAQKQIEENEATKNNNNNKNTG